MIGAFDVIEHIEDDVRVLSEIHRALKPGGGLVVTVPQHRWLWSTQDEQAHHVRRYTRRELVQKVEDAGFEVRRVTSFVFLLLPVLWLSRLRAKASGHGVPDEFRAARPLNALFGLVMTVERALINMGLDLPAGGSLLLVALKR